MGQPNLRGEYTPESEAQQDRSCCEVLENRPMPRYLAIAKTQNCKAAKLEMLARVSVEWYPLLYWGPWESIASA